MRPCDCVDQQKADMLQEQGIQYNDKSIELRPSVVVITLGDVSFKLNQRIFERFAKWYFEDQDTKTFIQDSHDFNAKEICSKCGNSKVAVERFSFKCKMIEVEKVKMRKMRTISEV